jgi:hypothetical protein
MNAPETSVLQTTVEWLVRHAGFPQSRLPAKAETMVCVAALAAVEAAAEARQRFALERRKPGESSALKAHVLRRTQVHYKCDNSAKV